MNKQVKKDPSATRVTRHRTGLAARGARRVEVTVPAGDATLIKAIASALRAGGREADRLRAALGAMLAPAKAQTGADLVAFFRQAPLVGEDLEIERDISPGRPVDLGR